jgi:ribonuclease VapC
MIVIDSSALIAILLDEPERDDFFDRIARSTSNLISSVSLLESNMVMYGRTKSVGTSSLANFLELIDAEIIPFDRDQSQAAVDAFIRYGKGNNPKARLNMGDCASYALAHSRRIPLLFKGQDFAATDVVSAM